MISDNSSGSNAVEVHNDGYNVFTGDSGEGISIDIDGNTYVTGVTFGGFPIIPQDPARVAQYIYGGNIDAFVAKLNYRGKVVYSTYLGGSKLDYGTGIDLDTLGNAYITGGSRTYGSSNECFIFDTRGSDTPTFIYDPLYPRFTANLPCLLRGGLSDAFVAKLNASGSSLIYLTYLSGMGYDMGIAIDVDHSGSAHVTGLTEHSSIFPNNEKFFSEKRDLSFVAKLNPAGDHLDYSVLLGGSNRDSGNGIEVDNCGNAYVTGSTESFDFHPLKNQIQNDRKGSRDAFIAKLQSDGNVVFSTYLGGKLNDYGLGIALDNNGNATITGATNSLDFPEAGNPFQADNAGDFDAFLAKLDSLGNLINTTYIGGVSYDQGHAIDIVRGKTYLAGNTYSSYFPGIRSGTTPLGGLDGFILKLWPRPRRIPIVFNRISFSESEYTVNENEGVATITVVRSGLFLYAEEVNYRTEDGTAESPLDYDRRSGTLTFNAGETSKTFNIPIVSDTQMEGDETISLFLNDLYCSNINSTAILIITDTDSSNTPVVPVPQ